MKKPILVLLASSAMLVAIAACSGDDDDAGGTLQPADGRIQSGDYEFTQYTVVADECATLPADTTVVTLEVDTAAGTVTLGASEGTYENGILQLDVASEYDWAPDFDCQEDNRFVFQGRTPTDTTITEGTIRYEWSRKSGAECTEAYVAYSDAVGQTVTLPCESEASFTMTALPPPVPITGTLTSAYGMAPLTLDGTATGNNFALNVNLGGTIFNQTGLEWTCYMPDPPSFPNYDIISSDGATYQFGMSVAPSQWTVGSHAIAGTSLSVSVALSDRFGNATGGSVEFLSAPTTTAGTCNIRMGNVPMAGEADPSALRAAKKHPLTNPRTTKQIKPRMF